MKKSESVLIVIGVPRTLAQAYDFGTQKKIPARKIRMTVLGRSPDLSAVVIFSQSNIEEGDVITSFAICREGTHPKLE